MTCRLDTAEEVGLPGKSGVLQRFAQDFLAANADKTGSGAALTSASSYQIWI